MTRKTFLLAWLLVVSFLGAFAQERTVPEAALKKTIYEVRYKWGLLDAKVADGILTLEPSEWAGHPATLALASVRAANIFRLFLNEEYKGILYMTPDTWEPLYFSNPIHYEGRSGGYQYSYNTSRRIIEASVVDKKMGDVHLEYPLDGATLEVFSLVYYLRCLDVTHRKPGASWPLSVILAGAVYPAILEYQGPDLTAGGDRSNRFCLHMTERGLMENGSGNELLIWVEPEGGREILALELPLSSGQMYVKLVR